MIGTTPFLAGQHAGSDHIAIVVVVVGTAGSCSGCVAPWVG